MKPVGWWTVGLLMGAMTVWSVGLGWIQHDRARVAHETDSTAAVHQAVVDVLQRQRTAAVERAELHRAAREQSEARAANAKAAGDQLVAETGQLKAELKLAATAGDSVKVLVAVVAAQEQALEKRTTEAKSLRQGLDDEIRRSAELKLAMQADSSTIRAQTERIATLEGKVKAGLPDVSRGTKLFGLPLPSRTVTFVVGLAVGVVASR